MRYYHGTTVGNLEYLKPFANPDSNLKKPCIYFATKEEIAVMYIWRYPFKFLTYEYDEQGNVFYYEWFEGGIEYFYRGLSGYVYSVVGEFDHDENIKIKYAAISETEAQVEGVTCIKDVAEKLFEYDKLGKIKIVRYADLAKEKRERHQWILAKKYVKYEDPSHPFRRLVEDKFPEVLELISMNGK